MSWFSSNYEKALLAAAAALALGLTYMGWSQFGRVGDDFNHSLKGRGEGNPAVVGADRIPKALQSLKLDHSWQQAVDEDRPVDLFTGIPLFIKRSDPQLPIDLSKGPEVHAGIPNTFWLDNRLDPGFADAPLRDPDGDGFNNQEEFLAKTDPTSKDSHPPLISKLRYVRDQSLVWVIRPGYGTEAGFPFEYEDGKGRKNKIASGEVVPQGELFFKEEPMKQRFKLLGHEVRKEVNPAINLEVEVTVVKIEDQRPNKKGQIYEIPAPLSRGRMNDFRQYDRSAVMSLQALGHEAEEIVVEENTKFSVLSSEPKKDYLLKKVTPESITVEYLANDGSRRTVEIPKGGMPSIP